MCCRAVEPRYAPAMVSAIRPGPAHGGVGPECRTFRSHETSRTGMACQSYLLGSGDSTLSIVQSGRQVTLRLGPSGDVTLNGTLSGETFWARGVIEAGATPRYVACPVGDTLRVTARVRREGQVKVLDATLASVACAECAPIEFAAARPRQYAGRRRS